MILNSMMCLTYRELEVFELLMRYDIDIIKGVRKPMSITEIRRQIMLDTKVNKNNLTAYINTFVDKKLVVRDEDRIKMNVNPELLPIITDNKIEVNFTLAC